jgi:hypothetical protein
LTFDEVIERVGRLTRGVSLSDRNRIRSVLNGGAKGVQAVLDWGVNGINDPSDFSLGIDLPTANVMHSGLERLAQRVGRAPTLKTDLIPIRDTEKARKAAEKKGRIVRGWDDMCRIELQYPQIGRWLPGYGFTLHVIREKHYGDTYYPMAELRDPYDVYPGQWGPSQQPNDVAIIREVSRRSLQAQYPEHTEALYPKATAPTGEMVPLLGGAPAGGSWEEGNTIRDAYDRVKLIEYICESGTYVLCADAGVTLAYIPNPLESGPPFVMMKRFSFDQLQSHFHHVFGVMAMMGKLNLLGLIATEDSTFRETNIVGEMIGDTYERGRKAVNEFEPGTRIERPTGDQLQQTWAAINILERQFRVVSNYDVAQDGQSPNSFATGQGIRELGSAANENVREYQTVIRHGMELIDRKRLEWEDKMHASQSKRVFYFEGGTQSEETYTPGKDIAGDYRTRRVFGAMATFDENSKIISGLQLLQARVFDRRTVIENLDGVENVSLILERIDQDQAREQLLQALGQRASENDPAALMALIEIHDQPSGITKTLKKMFTAEEPTMSPEEQAMAAGGLLRPESLSGAGSLPSGPPPPVQSILAQMEAPGGGAQTVGTTQPR